MKLIMENWRKYIKEEELDDEAGHDDDFDTEDLIDWIGGYKMADDDDRHPDDEDLSRIKGLIERFEDDANEISIGPSGDYLGAPSVDEIYKGWKGAIESKRDNSIAARAESLPMVGLLPKLELYKIEREKEFARAADLGPYESIPRSESVVALTKEIITALGVILKKLQGQDLTTRENN